MTLRVLGERNRAVGGVIRYKQCLVRPRLQRSEYGRFPRRNKWSTS